MAQVGICLLLFFISIIYCYDDYPPRFSTFGDEFKKGTNRTCGKQYFNSDVEDVCRIFSVESDSDECKNPYEVNSKENCKELNVTAEIFRRDFKSTNLIRLGLNITSSIFKNTDKIKFKINVSPDIQWCQIVDVRNFKIQRKLQSVVWVDGFFFFPNESSYPYSITVSEFPSGCKRYFHSIVPDMNLSSQIMQNISEWTPELFVEPLGKSSLNVMFQTVPQRFNVLISEYFVSLKTYGNPVEGSPKTVRTSQPNEFIVRKFENLVAGDYELSVKPNCAYCQTATYNFQFNKYLENNWTKFLIACLLGCLVVIIFVIFLYYKVIKPRKASKVLSLISPTVILLSSYDSDFHANLVMQFARLLSCCGCKILLETDKIRNVELSFWLSDQIKNCDIVFILWSEGAILKRNNKFDDNCYDPAYSLSKLLCFTFEEVIHHRLNGKNLKVGSIFWNENMKRRLPNGFETTKKFVVPDDWKKLLQYIHPVKNGSHQNKDLNAFEAGMNFLEAHANPSAYKLEKDPLKNPENFLDQEDAFNQGIELQIVPQMNREQDSGFHSLTPSEGNQQRNRYLRSLSQEMLERLRAKEARKFIFGASTTSELRRPEFVGKTRFQAVQDLLNSSNRSENSSVPSVNFSKFQMPNTSSFQDVPYNRLNNEQSNINPY